MAEQDDATRRGPDEPPTSLALGRYEILLEIASGGMATVYIGRQRGVGGFERVVAIKRLHHHLTDVPEVAQSLMDEARIAALVRHPNVVSVHDVCELGREYILVMDYVDGTSLSNLMRAAARAGIRIPLGVGLRIVCDALQGLHAAHEQTSLEGRPLGIVHRDATPHNILLGADGSVRLTDFGVAKAAERSVHTATGVTKGKIKYMAPEQARGEPLDRRADLFAMGIVLTELVTGKRSFEDHNDAQILIAISTGQVPAPRDLDPNVPPELDAIVRRALTHSTQARWPTAKELAEALERWGKATGALASQGEVAELVDQLEGERIRASRDVLRRRLAETAGLGPGTVSSPAVSIPMSTEPPGSRQPPSQPTVGSLRAFTGASPPRKRSAVPWLAAAAGVLALVLSGASILLVMRSKQREASALPSEPASASVLAPAAAPPASCPEGMLKVPSGKFFMGSDEPGASDDEKPAFQVTLDAFCIDRTEVTVRAFRKCSDRGECRRPTQAAHWPGITEAQRKIYEAECNGTRSDRQDHPVNCVDHAMASQYCAFKKARLPSEAEWEYATRGSDGRLYPWGDAPPTETHLNACGKECVAWGEKVGESLLALHDSDDGHPTTAPVGSFHAGRSQWGAHDLAGNVWEWVGAWHAPYTTEPKRGDAGPASGEKRVIRGGAWNGGDKSWLRPSFRYAQVPEARHPGIGFRCARSL